MWGRKIETNAILLAFLPVLIWLLASGKISKFKSFGVELDAVIEQVTDRAAAYATFIEKIRSGNLGDLPGFVGSDATLLVTATKGEALERFSAVDADDLPVVRANGEFAGVLSRGKLHSNLLASIFRAARAARP